MKQSVIVLWIVCACLLIALLVKDNDCNKPVAHHERNLSPHEQQPEPIPAMTQGGFDVERWIL